MRFLCRARESHIDPLHGAPVRSGSGPVLSARGQCMIDFFLLALGVGFFGLMVAYAAGCERV
jgi:hypothetical protein